LLSTKDALTAVCLTGVLFFSRYGFRPQACTISELACDAFHLSHVSEESLDGESALINASPPQVHTNIDTAAVVVMVVVVIMVMI
jgi:hypothetical protein